ncbi:hypothetical protein J5N97_021037 [Dioscorea zingiberensis]|uniref:Beta-glucosidase n=1 Tax=Dioscorea zingiberensis TaxID=325984 RepID=A0A9D5CGX5_9LILI|nr:hypothetical protein J5N97_021037 [Dioscorea zingiberensis]
MATLLAQPLYNSASIHSLSSSSSSLTKGKQWVSLVGKGGSGLPIPSNNKPRNANANGPIVCLRGGAVPVQTSSETEASVAFGRTSLLALFLVLPLQLIRLKVLGMKEEEVLAFGTLSPNNTQAKQGGQVGITLVCMWYRPYDESKPHMEAATRALDFMLAWYMEPLVHGFYPFNMKALVRDRLPTFSKEEAEMIKGSYDFIGINYYTARYARGVPFSHDQPPFLHINEAYAEQLGKFSQTFSKSKVFKFFLLFLTSTLSCIAEAKDSVPIGESELLLYIRRHYDNPPIYITENGISNVEHPDMTKEEALADDMRKDYLALHLAEIREAIREGANVKGYFAWSLVDNFEWEHGYTERFGLNYVDFNTLERIPKHSAKWFSKFCDPNPHQH